MTSKETKTPVVFHRSMAAKLLPLVSSADNKVLRGRGLLFAGSEKYPGAGILAAQAALRVGCGYVTLAQEHISVSLENPDFLLCDLAKRSWQDSSFDAVLVGPGFGVTPSTAEIIRELKRKKVERVLLDADALTVCAREKLFPLLPSWVATPHSGELSLCLGIPSAEINRNRVRAVLEAQKLFGCIVLLKGDGTLIASSKRVYKIPTGNSALAKAGTGDVLAGMIVGLMAQRVSPLRATLLGAYVHGATANLWKAKKKDLLSMRAVEVIELLPSVLFKLRYAPLRD